jgi:hypothetical protein
VAYLAATSLASSRHRPSVRSCKGSDRHVVPVQILATKLSVLS